MTQNPDAIIEPANPITDGHAEAEFSPPDDGPKASAIGVNFGVPEPHVTVPIPEWSPTGSFDPRTGAWIWGGSATVPEGVSEPSAEGCPDPVRTPVGEGHFGASPTPFLPPIGGLPEGTPVSPAQAALDHRPWDHSTGPRTPEGKQRSALNGKNRQIGVLSVRELRAYKRQQKGLLETLDSK